jgi:hypothetical protein
MINKWEYKTVKLNTKGVLGGILDTQTFDIFLNELGSQGWELVSTFATSAGHGSTREAVAVLKRQIQQ